MRVEDQGDRLVVFNRAEKRGALCPEFYKLVLDAIAQAEQPRIRSVILTGDGPFFCAGGDLNILIERRKLTEPDRKTKIEGLHDVIRAVRASPVPTICAVEGGAAGAGLSLALACDLLVSSEHAKFTAAYVKAGLVPDGGLTAALARMVPRQLAMQMCLLGQSVPASRFDAFGMLASVTKEGAALSAAQDIADRLAAGPRQTLGEIRTLVGAAYDVDESSQLDAERDAMARAQGGSDAAEGIAAFLEKRKPRF